jgi:hypothetical protein
MRRSVFWALVLKDLYLLRGLVIAMLVFGLATWWLMRFGGKVFAVAGLLFLTTNVAGAIFIAMYALLSERKEQARLFALSLPISGVRYDMAKLFSASLAFLIPWLVLTGIALAGVAVSGGAERGLLVYVLLIQGFVLAMFCVLLGAMFAITTEAMSGFVVLTVNICFSLFMMQIHQPEIMGPWRVESIVWTPFSRAVLGGELLAIALSLAGALYLISRRRDHI